MFVRCVCKNLNEKKKNEIYEVLGALCQREQIQIEEQADAVVITPCVQGKIYVTEDDHSITLTSSTRHGGPGFHAFVVDLMKDLQVEVPGIYEMYDDLNYSEDENFDRLVNLYVDEISYLKGLLRKEETIRNQNYMYDETFFLPIEKEGRILTAIGDMDEQEFLSMDEQELMNAFFVWNDWDKNAQYYKNAALTLLAKEGVGDYVAMNEKTLKHADEICDFIELAHRLDPLISLPVAHYDFLTKKLGRKHTLKDARPMEQEVIQYRCEEVYHLFEDLKVVAHGASQRSVDPTHPSLILMSPYTSIEQWDWLIQASHDPSICDHTDGHPTEYKGKTIRMQEDIKEGITILDASIERGHRVFYIHAVVADPKNVAYINQCIRESDFQQE